MSEEAEVPVTANDRNLVAVGNARRFNWLDALTLLLSVATFGAVVRHYPTVSLVLVSILVGVRLADLATPRRRRAAH